MVGLLAFMIIKLWANMKDTQAGLRKQEVCRILAVGLAGTLISAGVVVTCLSCASAQMDVNLYRMTMKYACQGTRAYLC